MEPESIRSVLETEIAFLRLRHQQGQELLEGIGESAPAFGMVGTLIGLVNMLANMDDPKAIGPSMAVAAAGVRTDSPPRAASTLAIACAGEFVP